MIKKKYILIILTIILLVIISLILFTKKEKNFEDAKTTKEKVKYQMKNLTLEEKIAQMIIVSYDSSEMTPNLKSILEKNTPGGFILFSNNITNYENTLKFINDIKKTSDIPMFISIDQEGGLVQRLNKLEDTSITIIPSMNKIGKTNDTKLAYNIGKVIGEELSVFGINMNFAPVIDVLYTDNTVIGNRSFGNSEQLVSVMGVSLAKGLEDTNVIPVYKHFPGHGSTKEDSHYELPILNKAKDELMKTDIVPFKYAIENGAEIIMIGHIGIPNITGDNTPASLSKTLITDILKKELNFKGLVITDALNMGAITNNYKEQEIYELAINAGVDILLMPNSSSSAIELILDSIHKGTIKEEQINKSVEKILTLKYEKLEKKENLSEDYLNSKEHQSIIENIN